MLTCNEVRLFGGGSCCRRDVVIIADQLPGKRILAGEIWLHVEINAILYSLVNLWTLTGHEHGAVSWRTEPPQLTFIETRDIYCPVINCSMNGGRRRTLLPWTYREFQPVAPK